MVILVSKPTRKYKLHRMRKKGIPFMYNGIPFYPLSQFLRLAPSYMAKWITQGKNPTTYGKGLKGVMASIPILQRQYPSPTYQVYINPVEGRGVDVLVMKNAIPYAVYEITNYDPRVYMNARTRNRYLTEFKKWECERYLVVSFLSSLKNKKTRQNYSHMFKKLNVTIIPRGYTA